MSYRNALFYLLLIVLSSGCAPALGPEIVRSDPEILANTAFVFGKVNVLSAKAPAKWEPFGCEDKMLWQCPDSFRLVILRTGDPKPIKYRLTGDGSFAIPLGAGQYFLAQWEWYIAKEMRSITSSIGGRIGASFEISDTAQASYIGDLSLLFQGNRVMHGLEDHFDTASQALLARHPGVSSARTGKGLLKFQDPPGGEKFISACDSYWGAHCDENFRGVVPVQPEQGEGQFPVVGSLNPTLSWKPAAREGLTYDVAIYEVIPYGMAPSMRYVQGRLVEYEEAVSAANYTVRKQLKPDASYFWSVRLRDGDTTSDWSSMSYRKFAFLLVAAAWESQTLAPFRFKTP